MPHVTLVPFTGLRVREKELQKYGVTFPGLVDRAQAIAELPALGLLTLAGMLPRDWTCSYRPYANSSEELLESVLADSPSLVAVSALTASVKEAYSFSLQIRGYGIPVVLGGLHATACSEEARPFCNSVVIGEGEAVWHQVLADCEQGNLQPTYSSFTGSRKLSWPTPKFDLIPHDPPRFTLQTQRGCPLACEFCGASRLLGPFREKPVANIRQELQAIGALADDPIVELADDNTFVGSRQPEEFFQAFSDADVRYFTETDWRIGTRRKLPRGLASSGCVQVLVGIESLVFRYPGMGRKAAELQQMMDAVHAIQDAGVAVNGCFIVGAEGETRESIDRLVAFILESPFAEVQLTLQTPFPETELYRRLQREQRLIPARDWSYYTLFDVTFEPDRMSVQELEQAFFAALAQVYSAEATRRRNIIRKDVWKRHPRFKTRRRS